MRRTVWRLTVHGTPLLDVCGAGRRLRKRVGVFLCTMCQLMWSTCLDNATLIVSIPGEIPGCGDHSPSPSPPPAHAATGLYWGRSLLKAELMPQPLPASTAQVRENNCQAESCAETRPCVRPARQMFRHKCAMLNVGALRYLTQCSVHRKTRVLPVLSATTFPCGQACIRT